MSRSGSKKTNNNSTTVTIRGKEYRFSSVKELRDISKKTGLSIPRIKSKINNTRRVIYSYQTGAVIPVDIVKDNITGILKTKFGIGRVLSKNIYNNKEVNVLNKKKEIELLKEVEKDETVKLLVRLILFINPYSLTKEEAENYQPPRKYNQKFVKIVTDALDDKKKNPSSEIFRFKKFYDEDGLEIFDIGELVEEDKKLLLKQYLENYEARQYEIEYEGSGEEIYMKMWGNLDSNINFFINTMPEQTSESYKPIMRRIKNGYYGEILQQAFQYSSWGQLMHVHVDVLSQYQNRKLYLSRDGTISDTKIYQLEEWANIEYNNEGDEENSCAVKFIAKRFPNLFWEFKKQESVAKNGVKYMETYQFLELCDEHDINYEVYNVSGCLEKKHITPINIGLIRCIIYQNHIYPITGGKLRKKRNTDYKIKLVKDNNAFINTIKNYKIPKRIIVAQAKANTVEKILGKIEKIDIISFTSNNIRYINNPDYEICRNFLKKVDLLDMIYDDIRVTSLIGILEKSEKVPDVQSFIPDNFNFTKTPLLWKTNKKIDHDRVIVKDKNKAYACALWGLPYLIKFDFRKHWIRKFSDKDNLVDEHLYFVRVKEWTTVLPHDNLYAGYHLKECIKYGVEFEVVEELQTDTVANHYRKLIDLTMKYLDEDTFKKIWVRYIGCMESSLSTDYECKYKSIHTNDQTDFYKGYPVKFGKSHTMVFDVKEKTKHVRNKFVIATQIKDFSRMTIVREINKMGIKDSNIVQLKTDAIAYYGEKSDDLDRTNFFGWKDEKFKELDFHVPMNSSITDLLELGETPVEKVNNYGLLDLKINDNNKDRVRKLHMQYAGAGKTTYIIKKLIPELLKKGFTKEDIIVLTPTHYTLAEYKREGINCEIIQKYTFDNTIADEKYVIVDEIGCIETSCHDMIYKLVQAGKNIECFGDFNQLQPVGEDKKLNQEHYLNYLFKEINTNFVNYRNNFTKDYYDSLIYTYTDVSKKEDIVRDRLVQEITKWSSKTWKYVDYIICYRHSTKRKYNNLVLKSLGKKSWLSIGVKIVCKTNKLKDLGIWNKKEFIIRSISLDDNDEKKYILEDKYKMDKNVTVTEKQLKRNFEMAYACNVHQVQGATLDSYYWAQEDNRFINGNVAYTIVSRLRQKK